MKKKLIGTTCAVLMLSILFIIIPTTNVDAANKVKISKTKQTLYLGKTTTLKITGTSKKVTWKTSNKKVATVNSKGKVTTKKAGTAVISGKVKGKTYNCKITVKNPYLNKTKISLNTGKSYALKITGATAKKWTSSNPKIVKVSSKGVIKGLKKGTAKITCTSSNGKKYSTNVTVKSTTTKTTCSHSYVWETTKEATCTTEGERRYICSKCGTISKTEKTNKLKHNYDWKITENTRMLTCTECNSTTGVIEIELAPGVWGYEIDSGGFVAKINNTRANTKIGVNDGGKHTSHSPAAISDAGSDIAKSKAFLAMTSMNSKAGVGEEYACMAWGVDWSLDKAYSMMDDNDTIGRNIISESITSVSCYAYAWDKKGDGVMTNVYILTFQ